MTSDDEKPQEDAKQEPQAQKEPAGQTVEKTPEAVDKTPEAVDGEAPEIAKANEVEELAARLAKAEEDAKGYFAQLQRTMADFENYKKRVLRERDELVKFTNEQLILEMLEPIENLDRALEASRGSRSVRALRDGVAMTREQLWGALSGNGLARIQTVGCAFDAGLHEAVEQVADLAIPEGTVKEEVRSGYTLNGRVLRCAKVKVAIKKVEETKEG